MINVLLVDDHEMVRIGVGAYLSAQADIHMIAEAANGQQAVELGLQLRPDYYFNGFSHGRNGRDRSNKTTD